MPKHNTERYCADNVALAALAHDGLGWGHDLDCGCFTAPVTPDKRASITLRLQKTPRKGD